MKITTKQAVNALAGVHVLSKKLMDYETARKLFTWSEFLRQEWKSAVAFEKELIQRYGGKRQDDKTIQFETEENAAAFAAEMEAMKNTEIETALTPIDISKIGGGKELLLAGEMWEVLEPILLKAEETA